MRLPDFHTSLINAPSTHEFVGISERRALAGGIHRSLAALVRSMNCYYSNLIEGHDTHLVDIERALRQDFSADPPRSGRTRSKTSDHSRRHAAARLNA
jgi:hypothetical protein